MRTRPLRRVRPAVTLPELMVVLLCMAVAAAIVMPATFDGPTTRLRAAADLLVADLEYARSESMSNADDPRLVVFDAAANRYHLARRSNSGAAVTDPVSRQPYTTEFGSGRAASLPGVRIGNLRVGGDNRLMFGANGELDQNETAEITLTAGTSSITITLDPVIGEATIGPLR